jgi:hypothetical protein
VIHGEREETMQRVRPFIAALELSLMMLIVTFSWVLSASAQTGGGVNQQEK